MEAKELMIGDYVSYVDTFNERKIGKVTDLHHNESWEKIYVDFCDQNPYCKSKIASVQPIPFTEDSAKKNGLVDCGDDIYQDDKRRWGIDFRKYEFYTFDEEVEITIKPILFYHNLQHALRLVDLKEVADNLKV